LLTQTLQQDYVKDRGELELKLTQPWKDKKISDEPLTVKIIEMPTMGVVTSFIVRFELRNAEGTIGTWQLPVQAHVWREAWVAHSMLNAAVQPLAGGNGDVVDAGDALKRAADNRGAVVAHVRRDNHVERRGR